MAERTRILHVIGALVAGGAERFVVDLVIAMRASGMPVELICTSSKIDKVGRSWLDRLEQAGIPVHRGPSPRVGLPAVLWLRRLFVQPDVAIVHIHLHNVEIAYYLSRFLHRRRYRVVRTLHNTSMPHNRLAWRAFKSSDIRHSVSCGEASHEAYTGRVEGALTCIPYGIHFSWPRHNPNHRDDRLRNLKLDPATTHFVAVGRQDGDTVQSSQKAQDDLIKAWKQGSMTSRGCMLHFLGDGPRRPDLEMLASGDPGIVFHGVVPNVHEWMGACDCFVMPSRWEGLPLAGIEAVGTGIPCIFSEIPSLRELRSPSAAFFPMGDAAALSACLIEHVGVRRTASDAEVSQMRDRFGIERAARQYREVYQSIPAEVRVHFA